MSGRALLWATVLVLLVGAALRLSAFAEIPPGLYHDEAYHGLDAQNVLQGDLPLYFAANNGREPLYIYLVTLAIGLLGESPFALRLVSVPIGLLTIAATVAMGRALFSRRVGILAAAVLAVTLWHVHLSRVGFRAVLLPLFVALLTWQVARGVQTGKQRHWVAAGGLYGLSFYTYTAARFTPFALAAFCLYVLVTQRASRGLHRAPGSSLWRGIGLAFVTALTVAAPLAVYAAAYPEVVLGRPGQVFVFSRAINGGDPWGTLGAHTLRTLGMFFVRGDRIWRHNVPWRPVFDPLLGAAFLLGVAIAVRRARRDPAAGFVLVWTVVMALPTLLAEDAPHFLRSAGLLPVVTLLPALGLDWLVGTGAEALARWRGRTSARARLYGWVWVALVLAFGLASTTWSYFGNYARDPYTGYWFERGAVTLAGRINGFLGAGWDGERMTRGGFDRRRVYLDPRLWEEWPQVRFLVAGREAVTVGLEAETQAPDPAGGSVAVLIWPYGEWRRAWALLPAPADIVVEEGPLSQGDRDPAPFTTYLAFFAAPSDPSAPALARFSGGVELLDLSVVPVALDRLRVRACWRATEPLAESYTVFVHYLRDGQRMAQADARPAGGRYPTTHWRRGDVINDDHFVEGVGPPLVGRDAVRLGLWQPESGAVLYLLDEAGNPAGDWFVVPVSDD
jgi:4-amino-4-deoxy-L-arabinose transferase-like glycosyltransferase